MSQRKTIAHLSSLLVGIVFVISALGKMMDAGVFGELISSYGFEWFSVLSPLIILSEMAVGLCLVLRIRLRLCTAISFLMVLLFTATFAYAHLIHGVQDCGCFGSIDFHLPVWATYIRNALLLLLAFLAWWYGKSPRGTSTQTSHGALWALSLLLLVCAFWTGNTWFPSTFYMNRFAPRHRLLGQQVDKTVLGEYIHVSNDSTYLVWVFSYSCDGCINSIENIKQYQTGVADHFIPLSVTDDKDGRKRKLLDIPFAAQNVGTGLAGFIKVLPTLLYIEDGRIKFVIEQSVPHVYTFKSNYLEMSNNEILQQINHN